MINKVFISAILASVVAISGCRDEIAQPEEAGAESVSAGSCAGLEGFEYTLCSDPEVREMDDELAVMVNRLVANSAHDRQSDLRAEQKRWEQSRDGCLELSVAKRRACIDARYSKRMNEVRDALGQGE